MRLTPHQERKRARVRPTLPPALQVMMVGWSQAVSQQTPAPSPVATQKPLVHSSGVAQVRPMVFLGTHLWVAPSQ